MKPRRPTSPFVLGLLLLSCARGGRSDPGPTLPPSTVAIDPAVVPSVSSIPGIGGGAPRPVSALTDASGITADFVRDELIVFSDSPTTVAALAARWKGTVVEQLDPAAAGLPGVKPAYLLRVDAAGVDASDLPGRLGELQPAARADLRFSDGPGRDLLAVAAEENLRGTTVVLNFVPRSGTVASGSTAEANVGFVMSDPTYKTSENYTPDAARWSYMRKGGTQAIDVADAWRALAAMGKLSNKVSLAVFDGGILDSKDVPPSAFWASAPGSPNPAKCEGTGGSFDCPWHGTGVVAAAMAVPDNGFGVAGPAGPVARPILAPSPGDVWSGIKFFLVDVPLVLIQKPKIINFSFTARIPLFVNWALNPPLDILFSAVRDVWGTLVFAAAGNSGEDVDETDSLGFKIATWIPCQTSKVVCVGSMQLDGTHLASFSNWANTSSKIDHTNSVDIYGPGYLWIPKAVGGSVLDEAVQSQGTSLSSPFVAGVAALVWAADPTLGPNQVEQILLSTAQTQDGDLVQRYVKAFAAVKAALGVTNFPPIVSITSEPDPLDAHSVTLRADVSDIEDDPDCCAVSWSSSVDGALGTGEVLTRSFASGTRKVTATVTDSQGASTTRTLDLVIAAQAPSVAITAPTGQPFTGIVTALTGIAGEGPNDLCQAGSGATRLWTSSAASDEIGNPSACSTSIRFVGAGPRTLTFRVTDKFGESNQASTLVEAVAPAGLVVTITLPTAGSTVSLGSVQTLEGFMTGGVPPYTHRWIWHRSGCADYVVPPSLPVVFPIPKPPVYELWDTSLGSFCTPSGLLELEVTDATAQVGSASVPFSVLAGPN